jgi:hypothetical protein
MSSTKKQNEEFEKFAQSKGYNWNSHGTKLVNEQGKSAQVNPSGQSYDVGGTHYSTLSDAKKSKKWGE